MDHLVSNEGLRPEQKLANVQRWFDEKRRVFVEDYQGNTAAGQIEVRPESGSGLWGYGGDSIAVTVVGKTWPSARVRLEQPTLSQDWE